MRIILELDIDYPSGIKDRASEITRKIVGVVEETLNENGAFISSFKIEVGI